MVIESEVLVLVLVLGTQVLVLVLVLGEKSLLTSLAETGNKSATKSTVADTVDFVIRVCAGPSVTVD